MLSHIAKMHRNSGLLTFRNLNKHAVTVKLSWLSTNIMKDTLNL